jgi:hypothetical protein
MPTRMNKTVNGATTSVIGGEAAAIIAYGIRISWGVFRG